MTEERLKEFERLAFAATEGPWRTRYGGNFTQVWRLTTNMSQPSSNLVADVNFRISNAGENTPAQSHRNAQFIAAANPAAVLELIAEIRILHAALDKASHHTELESHIWIESARSQIRRLRKESEQ